MANRYNKDRKEIALRNQSRSFGKIYRENKTAENYKKLQDKMNEYLMYISNKNKTK